MLKLFTKKDVAQMINQGLTFQQIQDKIGFENIGQGYGYKSDEAWVLGQKNRYKNSYICYIPEYCYTDNSVKQIDIDSLYTVEDFKNLCYGTIYDPEDLFDSVDWQHPSSLLLEWLSYNN